MLNLVNYKYVVLKFILISVISFFISISAFAEVVYIHVEGLTSKDLKSFQSKLDQQNGLKYLGYCQDLSVVLIDINRTPLPDNEALYIFLKKNGYDKIEIKSSVSQELFFQHCNNFEPRQ